MKQYPPEFFAAFMRASVYVNCWCMQEHESEALWRIYGGKTGVAIRTRYSRLARLLPSSVFLGQVRYFDPNTGSWPTLNALNLAMFKRVFFEHESECRVVLWDAMRAAKSKGENGRQLGGFPKSQRIPLDLEATIDAVVTSPLAPDWFHDCIRTVVDRFAPEVMVCKSDMLT